MKLKEMIGQRFGRLTVLNRVDDHFYPSGRHDACYTCVCDCGNHVDVLGIHLRSGHTTSCGCVRIETSRQTLTTHGKTDTRLYTIWKNVHARCLNHNHNDYPNYGGRGILICDEWRHNFAAFEAWALCHGYSDDLSLDRINVNGNYEPSNCRWVTQKDQCNNTRSNIYVTMENRTMTLKQWAEHLGLKYGTIVSRVERGWDPVTALITPVRLISKHS